MAELAVPFFMVAIFMTPVVFGFVMLLFGMLSSREPDVYKQLGSPSLARDRNMALAQLARFLCSRQPEQLSDRYVYVLANVLRILIPLYVCTVIPLLYRLVVGPSAA